MIGKLIENWLTKTSERGYMPAFCQLLISQGYKLLYVSPHGPDEAGKDIIAKDKDGKIYAFQLKDGDINLNLFRQYKGELEELLKHPIIHPSVHVKSKFKSILVVNGRIQDPVRTRIIQLNQVNWNNSASTKLDYIQKEQLVADFSEHYGDFFPGEPKDFKDFLEFYISDGKDFLSKEKFTSLLAKHFLIQGKATNNKISSLLSSSLILTNYALTPWISSKNYVVQIEVWVSLLAYMYAQIERYELKPSYWEQSVTIVKQFIDSLFNELLDEVTKRNHLIEGDWPSDGIVYPARVTIILGYLCGYALYKRLQNSQLEGQAEEKILNLNVKYDQKMKFWGEVFTPHLFNYFWFNLLKNRSTEAVGRLSSVLNGLTNPKKAPEPYGFPSPYFDYETTIRMVNKLMPEDINEHFVGQSYTMWSIVQTFTRRNYRDIVYGLWPQISRTQYLEIIPENKWEYLTWKVGKGNLIEKFPKQTQSWRELVEDAQLDDYNSLPKVLVNDPAFALLFLLVFPQRLTPTIIKLLDKQLVNS